MPTCRNCGARLSKFDKDICPVCGTLDPLKGVSSETVEITSQVDLSEFQEGQKVVRRRKKMLILFLSIGFTGLGFFYLKKKKEALFYIAINILLFTSGFLLLHLLAGLNIALAIILPIVAMYVMSAIFGLIYFYTPNLKDGEGEFVV